MPSNALILTASDLTQPPGLLARKSLVPDLPDLFAGEVIERTIVPEQFAVPVGKALQNSLDRGIIMGAHRLLLNSSLCGKSQGDTDHLGSLILSVGDPDWNPGSSRLSITPE